MMKSAVILSLGFALASTSCSSEAAEGPGNMDGDPVGPTTESFDVPVPYKDPKELLTPPAEVVGETDKQTQFLKDFPGIKIRTIKEGDGEAIRYDEVGRFQLVITLSNGKEIVNTRKGDATGQEGGPRMLCIRCGKHTTGLALALVGMKVGARRSAILPPEAAYGQEGDYVQGVPENATISVYAELVEIVGPRIRRYKAGSGGAIQRGQTGIFHYTGILAKDGTKFDSSRDPGKTALTTVLAASSPQNPQGVIEGWVSGLAGMQIGERRWVYIPADMGYGAQGSAQIPPNSDLIFEAELMKIVK